MTPADELALLGSQKETVSVLGRKILIQTLDADEEASATAAVSMWDPETRKRVLKVEKLARAIKSIDGAPFSVSESEMKDGVSPMMAARRSLFKWQGPVLDRVHAELEKLEKRRDLALDEIEKNAMSPLTSSGVGR